MKEKEVFTFYTKKRLYLMIPGVALLLSLIFYLAKPTFFQNDTWKFILNGIASTTVIWAGCMGIVRLLWKKFPWERYPLKHLIYEIVFILIYLSLYVAIILVITEGFNLAIWKTITGSKILDFFNTVLITFLITAIHEAFYFYRQWQENFSKSVQLQKENIQAQYNSLKAQVNPHFLFNSLNSLASLVEDNSKAEKFVLDLSEFLRFVLLSSERETVKLKDELENLEKYIWLMSIRFGENFAVSTKISSEAMELSLPPLVLQILVENCIKHNVITHAMPLHISIESETNKITVSNNLQKKSETNSTGQGLSNISGRYRYFTDEEIKVLETSDYFSVTVPLISTPTSEEHECKNTDH